jgi:hypothetical protein
MWFRQLHLTTPGNFLRNWEIIIPQKRALVCRSINCYVNKFFSDLWGRLLVRISEAEFLAEPTMLNVAAEWLASRGPYFKSWPGDRLSWLSPSRQMPRNYVQLVPDPPLELIKHTIIRRYSLQAELLTASKMTVFWAPKSRRHWPTFQRCLRPPSSGRSSSVHCLAN